MTNTQHTTEVILAAFIVKPLVDAIYMMYRLAVNVIPILENWRMRLPNPNLGLKLAEQLKYHATNLARLFVRVVQPSTNIAIQMSNSMTPYRSPC